MKVLLTLSFFTLFVLSGFSQNEKTIKLKKYEVSFKYDPSTVVLSKKEIKKGLITCVEFFEAIGDNDLEKYKQLLSDTTLTSIESKQIERKFERYQTYGFRLKGNLNLFFIEECKINFTDQGSTCYTFAIEIPKNIAIEHRVGFDPTKKIDLANKDAMFGLILIYENNHYQIVIPW
jgi:hypothetical protein